jgi:hypothetical protein
MHKEILEDFFTDDAKYVSSIGDNQRDAMLQKML